MKRLIERIKRIFCKKQTDEQIKEEYRRFFYGI
jgi:hypothetical protein